MKINVKEGNYAKLGVQQQAGQVTFTFCGEKEDICFVVLVRKSDMNRVRVEVPESFCLGSLRSITIVDLDVTGYVYYYEINGIKQIDPCAQRIVGREIWNDESRKAKDYEVFCGFAKEDFDWKNDLAPEIPRDRMLLYKLHVRGFTMDADKQKYPGTFQALMNRIGYLEKLGITTVELMPVYEFEEMPIPVETKLPEYVKWEPDEEDMIQPESVQVQVGRLNYWGYGPGNYFAVKASYASNPEQADREYKTLIRRLHAHHMECIMEMYFPEDTNHNLIVDVLRYWVREYHVDGFHLLGESIPVTAIVQDNLLSRTKIMCEKYDPGVVCDGRKYMNLYVYKDEYMYPARKILNHLNGNMKEFIDQQRKQGSSLGYVNYITSNNGFTLADLFMYNDRHNEENGENNLDGNAWNYSNNYGIEGPTRKRYINSLRRLKWRNSMLMLMLAQGVPMLWAGDEIGNSQKGNNNAYCQDNAIGWVNWKNEKTHRKELVFLQKLVRFRKEHPIISNEMPFQFSDYHALGCPDLSFHGESAWILEPTVGRMCIGMLYCGAYTKGDKEAEDVYVAYNFFSAVSSLALPQLDKHKRWYLVMDSSNDSQPYLDEAVLMENSSITMMPQSICVLVGRRVTE